MLLIHPKFGYHTGPGGNPTGLGDHLRTLDAAGIPVFVKAVDTTSGIDDALALPNPHGVSHTIVYRRSNAPDYSYDTPDYLLEPSQAAAKHWAKHLAAFPQAVKDNRDRVWVEVMNEVRKQNSPDDKMYNNMAAADWMGLFAVAISGLALAAGFKIALFGWSGGEPEYEHWLAPGMAQFLQIAAVNRSKIAVALHEYSFVESNILDGYPSKIGRFGLLFNACKELGVGRPTVIITEWGWTHDSVPSPEKAIQDLDIVGEIYAQHSEILGAAIWYLGPGFQGIADKAQKLIAPTTKFMIDTTYEIPDVTEPPVEPPAGDGAPRVDYKRVYAVIPESATLAEAMAIFAENWSKSRITVGGSYDDAMIGSLTDKTAILYGIPVNERAAYDDFRDTYYPGTKIEYRDVPGRAADPLAGIQLGPLLDQPYVYTSLFNSPRDYDNDGINEALHEGIDADVLGTGDSKANVLATYDGVVDRSLDSTGGYGQYVRLLHSYNGIQFYTRYAHLDARFVTAGQSVKKGQPVGEVGDTGKVTGEHVHFNIEGIGFGNTGYVVANVINPISYLPDPSVVTPPVSSSPVAGLHASADPGDLYGKDAEFAEFRALDGGVVKVLSAHSESSIRRLESENKGVEWIVRAFLNFGGRNISPQQFYNDTIGDTQRAINALKSQGVPSGKIWVELHNEPNLVQEGLGASWMTGYGFGNWLSSVLDLYRAALPSVKYITPGLSPGWSSPGERADSGEFWSEIPLSIIKRFDGIGVHAYWSKDFAMSTAVAEVAKYQDYGMPVWVTEASRNDRPALSTTDYGTEYATFVKELRHVGNVKGVTFFVASASNPYFGPECFVTNGVSKGWSAKIAQLLA